MEKDVKKNLFSLRYQKRIFNKLEQFLQKMSRDSNIHKILITGSVLNNRLGRYVEYLGEKYDRTYSDIDLVFIVKPKFQIRKSWMVLAKRPYWRVYRIAHIDHKFPIEALIVQKGLIRNRKAVKACEKKGIPIKLERSKNKYLEYVPRMD